MSLRDKISKNPVPAAIITGIIILISIVLVIYQLRPASTVTNVDKQIFGKGFFSDDNGKSYYVDDVKNIPPYSHNGKMAARAIVYMTMADKRFIAYLEQYKEADKKAIEDEVAKGKSVDEASLKFTPLVKRPLVGTWVDPANDKSRADYMKIITATSPDKKDPNNVVGPLRPGSNDLVTP